MTNSAVVVLGHPTSSTSVRPVLFDPSPLGSDSAVGMIPVGKFIRGVFVPDGEDGPRQFIPVHKVTTDFMDWIEKNLIPTDQQTYHPESTILGSDGIGTVSFTTMSLTTPLEGYVSVSPIGFIEGTIGPVGWPDLVQGSVLSVGSNQLYSESSILVQGQQAKTVQWNSIELQQPF